MHNKKITKKELIQKTGKSRATITRNLSILKELKLLERIGSDKTGYWKIESHNQ